MTSTWSLTVLIWNDMHSAQMNSHFIFFSNTKERILRLYLDGILPKGPYPPCSRMAERALLARYPRCVHSRWSNIHMYIPQPQQTQSHLHCTRLSGKPLLVVMIYWAAILDQNYISVIDNSYNMMIPWMCNHHTLHIKKWNKSQQSCIMMIMRGSGLFNTSNTTQHLWKRNSEVLYVTTA